MLRCVCACGPATTKHFVHFSSTRFSKLVLLKAEQGGSNHHTTLKAASSNWMRTRSSSHCYGYSDPTDSAILGNSNAFMISQKKQRLLRRQQFFLYMTNCDMCHHSSYIFLSGGTSRALKFRSPSTPHDTNLRGRYGKMLTSWDVPPGPSPPQQTSFAIPSSISPPFS